MTVNEWCATTKPDYLRIDRFIQDFYNNNPSIMGMGFDKKVTFGSELRDRLMVDYGATSLDFRKFTKTNKEIAIAGNMVNDPLNILLTWSFVEQSRKGASFDTELGKKYLVFLAVKMFTSKYNHFLKLGVNEDRMRYFINSLDNTFYLKRYGGFMPALMVRIDNFINLHHKQKKRLGRMNDNDYIMMIKDLSTRVMSFTKEIITKYLDSPVRYMSDDNPEISTTSSNMADVSNMLDRVSQSITLETDQTIVRMVIPMNKHKEFMFFMKKIHDNLDIQKKYSTLVKMYFEYFLEKYPNQNTMKLKREFLVGILKLYKTTPGSHPTKIYTRDIISLTGVSIRGVNQEQLFATYTFFYIDKHIKALK
jgi:hypothetical protein